MQTVLTRGQQLILVAVLAVFLAACTGNPGQSNDLYSTQQTDVGNLLNSNAETSSEQQSNSNNMTGEEPMKQLSDFEQIAATEATITTTKGDITFELYQDKAPLTVANFLNLAKGGYYDGIVFHRVIPDFMAQVGDPLTKQPEMQAAWGSGGPGYAIADEFGEGLKHNTEGMVSMANAGPNTGGSQFFITYEATPWLDGKHAIFGKVTQGMDILRQIAVGDKITKITYK
jgi:peptidyl-prolyl cis-trans isomerase B (cyclophilin B)